MSKFNNLSIMALMSLLTSLSYAQSSIKLAPNETKLLTNNTLWTYNATCNIQSNHQAAGKIKISVLKNKCHVNGKHLSTGQATFVTIKNNSKISVSAEVGTQINLINTGTEKLEASCI